MNAQAIYAKLKDRFGDKILEFDAEASQPYVGIDPGTLKDIVSFLRDDPDLDFDDLMCLSGIDHGEELAVAYDLYSMKHDHKMMLKAKLPRENPKIGTVSDLWKTANWHEREAYDLLGIVFEGHPDLRRILLPDDWEGYPLRKDYEIPEFYRGMKVAY